MDAKRTTIIITGVVVGLLILITIILFHFLGVSTPFFILAGVVGLAAILGILAWLIFRCADGDHRRTLMTRRRSVLEGEELRLEYSYLRKVAGLPSKFRYEVLQ